MQNKSNYVISVLVMGILLISAVVPTVIQSTSVDKNNDVKITNKNLQNTLGYAFSTNFIEWNYYKMITINHDEVESL